jgi:predicted nicotinamide N-methyase
MGVDITASDYHPRAREFLDRNILDNGLAPIKFQRVNFEMENPQLEKFDLIIASDLLYQPQHAENLSRLISAHSSDRVEVIVVDPGRENRASFTHKMIALGYRHHFTNFNRQIPESIRCKGRILHYYRQCNPAVDDIGLFKIHSRDSIPECQ